jgi:uncharacterized protein YutD
MMNPKTVLNTIIDKVENVLVYVKNCSFQKVKELKVPSETLFDKTKIKEFLEEFSKMKGRYIYVIESVGDNSTNKLICKTFLSFNNSKKRKKLKISKFNENTSKTIYVGTSKSLKTRLNQHFGFAGKTTYALHLMRWFPENLDLTLGIYKVSTDDKLGVELIEQTIWDMKEPQFGKRSGL